METKTKRIDLKASEADEAALRRAAENMKFETGKSPNVSSTIMRAVKEYSEKEVFYFDNPLYRNICDFYSLTQKYFQGIATDFESLKLGHISEGDFEKLLSSDFTDIEKRYFTSIDESLFKLQLSNAFVENNLRVGTEVPFNTFKANTLKNLENIQINRSRPQWTSLPLSISIFTLKDGIVTFSDEDKQRIKDKYCVTYIDSEVKREFLKLSLESFERLKKLYAIMLKNGFYDVWGYDGLFNVEANSEEVIFNKEVLKYITKI